MKYFTKLLTVISIIALLPSCNDENEPKDITAPEVSFTNLTAGTEIRNTVTISLDAKDNKGIDKIEIFVDGNLIATITEAPFEISWDSNTVPDGSHTVKVVVTDKSGNNVEKEITIVVKNILVSIDFASDQLYSSQNYSERGFVFLSDETGKIITSAEYNNGQHLELKSTSFNGNKFYLTEVFLSNDISDGNSVRLWTFADVERGKWMVPHEQDEDETYAGEATLNFSNAASLAQYYGYSNGWDEAYANQSSTSSVVRIKKTPSKLYVVRYSEGGNPAPRYQLYSNIVVGPNAINLGAVVYPLTKVTSSVPAGADASVELKGYLVANDYTEPYRLGYFGSDQNNLDIYYPGSTFPSYYIESYYDTDNASYSRGSRTEFGNFSPLQHSESFSYSSNKLTYSASGNYDAVMAGFFNQDETAYWHFVLPLGTEVNVPVLELPSFLNGLNIPSFGVPNYYIINDFESITNYGDFIAFNRNSTRGFDELLTDGKNYVRMEFYSAPTGGKVKHRGSRVGSDPQRKKN